MTVTVSPKFQIVIPKEIREKMMIKPGQKLSVIQLNDCLELVPVKRIQEMKGIFKGMDTSVNRDQDRI